MVAQNNITGLNALRSALIKSGGGSIPLLQVTTATPTTTTQRYGSSSSPYMNGAGSMQRNGFATGWWFSLNLGTHDILTNSQAHSSRPALSTRLLKHSESLLKCQVSCILESIWTELTSTGNSLSEPSKPGPYHFYAFTTQHTENT